jgi:hypothetical protein
LRGVRSSARALFGLSEHTESRASWSGVLDTMARDRELSDLAPLLNAVLGSSLPDNELTAQMSGEVRADNTRRLLVPEPCSGAGENAAHVRDRVFRQPSRYPVHASYRRCSPRTRVRDRARLIAR